MTFVSYSQNAEDVLLWRALGHVANGFYIDVGANDPVEHSVTKAFYERGWSGISIEPLPSFHQEFQLQRPRDVNLAIAAGAADGELTLYDVPDVRGWASPDQVVAEMHRAEGHRIAELTVPVRTLTSICAEHVEGEIHFLKIDVEGFEGEVLRGMDFARWRPWVLVIEATLPNSRETNHESWEQMVSGQHYRFVWFDGLNRWYVAEEHPELIGHFGIQPNVFDAFISHHLDKAWNHVATLDAALKDTDMRAQEEVVRAAQKINAAEQRAAAAKALLADERIGFRLELERARQDQVRNSIKLVAAQQDLAAIQQDLAAVQQDLAAAQQDLVAIQQDLAAVRQDRAVVTQALADNNAQLARLADEKLQAETQVEHLGEKMAHLHEAGRAMADWAHSLDERLKATLVSTSWKVTRPLRAAGSLVIALRRPNLARRVVNRLTADERVRRLVIPVLRKHPAINERVTASIASIKLDPPQQQAAFGVEVPEELKGLPQSARTVLADLQRARGNQQSDS